MSQVNENTSQEAQELLIAHAKEIAAPMLYNGDEGYIAQTQPEFSYDENKEKREVREMISISDKGEYAPIKEGQIMPATMLVSELGKPLDFSPPRLSQIIPRDEAEPATAVENVRNAAIAYRKAQDETKKQTMILKDKERVARHNLKRAIQTLIEEDNCEYVKIPRSTTNERRKLK